MSNISREKMMTYASVISLIENAEKTTERGGFLLAEGKLNGLDNVVEQLRKGEPETFPDDFVYGLQLKIKDAKLSAYEAGAAHYYDSAETAAKDKAFEIAAASFKNAYMQLQRAYDLIKDGSKDNDSDISIRYNPSVRDVTILHYIKEHGSATTSDVMDLLELSQSRVNAILQNLVSSNLLIVRGGSRENLYAPYNKKLFDRTLKEYGGFSKYKSAEESSKPI